jgi:hypothetical protein
MADTRFIFTRHTIPDRGRLIQSEVGNWLSGNYSVKRKWLAAVNLRLSNEGRVFLTDSGCQGGKGLYGSMSNMPEPLLTSLRRNGSYLCGFDKNRSPPP